MDRLSTWLQILDSYASFNVERRILAEVISAKQILQLDSTVDRQDLSWFFSRWSLTLIFDRNEINDTLQISQAPGRPFTVKRHSSCGRLEWLGDYDSLNQAFDRFVARIEQELTEPYRINWHMHPLKRVLEQYVGLPSKVLEEFDRTAHPFDDPASRLLRHDCVVYDWCDQRHAHYADS